MSKGHPHKSRYARLVSAFAASAFALLITLSAQQSTANTATASAVSGANVLTSYSQYKSCPYKAGDNRTALLRVRVCGIRSAITSH